MHDIKLAPPIALPVGTHGLFDVVVVDPGELVLIPKTELAKALAAMWLHMTPAVVLSLRHKETNGHHRHLWSYDTESVSFHFESRPHLTRPDNQGSPLGHQRGISLEEHDVALKAIEAHRAAKSEQQRKSSRRAQRGTR